MVETMTEAWRPMRPEDLPAVLEIAARVHPGFPEREEVFAERLRLSPEGCLLLVPGRLALGYAISHPWRAFQPPPLDSLLGALPASPATWYVHDVALLPGTRGSGMGAEAVCRLAETAKKKGLASLSLVAVGGSAPFWQRQGFGAVEREDLAAKLASYGSDARFMVRPLGP